RWGLGGAQRASVLHSASNSGPAARWIAPSTPPPPSRVRLAAFTIASMGSVVISATTISRTVFPISALRSVMDATISRGRVPGRCFKIDARAHTDVVIVRVKKAPRRAPAVVAQHFEEIVVGVEPAGCVERLCGTGKGDTVYIDAPIIPLPNTAWKLALVDQLPDECDAAQFRHQRGVERDFIDARQNLVL